MRPSTGAVAGVDWGASLTKLVVRRGDDDLDFELLPADAPDACRRALADRGVARLGATGGGAAALARRFPGEVRLVDEFAAWAAGAAALLGEAGVPGPARYLVVSLGTGTSVLLVEATRVARLGGTALGGGTLLGLAAGLIGEGDFDRLAELARRGSRRAVDLLVSEVYPEGERPLPGDFVAASFGKLARRLRAQEAVDPADVAHALMGLVAENVSRICVGLAAASGVSRIVFCGSTLRGNPALVGGLELVTRALGCEPVFPPRGEFAAALGALRLAVGDDAAPGARATSGPS